MIFIALGANLPGQYRSPEAALEAAKMALIQSSVMVMASSETWITPPVPISNQPFYRNSVISVETTLSAQELLELLHSIEEDFGRVREHKNEARVLDLDLIAYHDEILSNGDVLLPHPRMHQRGFVLAPLCEIAPDWVHPVLQKTARKLLEDLPESELKDMRQYAA